jgi:hypothetical protein
MLNFKQWLQVNEAATAKPIFAEGAPFAKIKDKGLAIMNKLIDTYGYSPILAAALCGNMFEESKFDPTKISPFNPKTGTRYYGLIQWDGENRWPKLKKLGEWTSLDNQLKFLNSELTTNQWFIKTRPVKPAIDALTNANSTDEEKAAAVLRAADIVTRNYEGAATSDQRRNSAKELYDLYMQMNASKQKPTQQDQTPVEPAPEQIGKLPIKPAQALS